MSAVRADASLVDADLALVRAAVGGDQAAFADLFEAHRRTVLLHCYRMLGSITEAEDMTQETFLRAWRKLDSFRGQATLRTWLYRIATNVCLDAISRSRRRVLPPAVAEPDDPTVPARDAATEIAWLEPYPDTLLDGVADGAPGPHDTLVAREGIELAFLAAIQHLPPRQRAVLIFRDLLHWSAAEVATLLDTTVVSVNSALQRARETLRARLPQSVAAASVDADTEAELLERYAQAWESADIDALVALLKEDATLAMPPSPSWYVGRDAVGTFIGRSVFGIDGCHPTIGQTRLVPVRGNGQPGFAIYEWADEASCFRPFGIMLLRVEDGAVAAIDGFLEPALPRFFGLPDAL